MNGVLIQVTPCPKLAPFDILHYSKYISRNVGVLILLTQVEKKAIGMTRSLHALSVQTKRKNRLTNSMIQKQLNSNVSAKCTPLALPSITIYNCSYFHFSTNYAVPVTSLLFPNTYSTTNTNFILFLTHLYFQHSYSIFSRHLSTMSFYTFVFSTTTRL